MSADEQKPPSERLDISRLKVKDLKDELKSRGLTLTGLKPELTARLTEALAKEDAEWLAHTGSKRKHEEATSENAEAADKTEHEVASEAEPPSKRQKQENDAPSTVEPESATAPTTDETAEVAVEASVATEESKSDPTALSNGSTQKDAEPSQDVAMTDEKAADPTPAETTTEAENPTTKETKKTNQDVVMEQDDKDAVDTKAKSPAPAPALESRGRSRSRTPPRRQHSPTRSMSRSRSRSPPRRRRRSLSRSRSRSRPRSYSHSRSPQRRERSWSADRPSAKLEPEPSPSLYLSNLVRPFTLPALKEVLGEFGDLEFFWIDSVKSHAYLTYKTTPSAEAAHKSLNGTVWPELTGKALQLVYVPSSKVESLVAEEDQAKITRRGRLELLVEPARDGKSLEYRLIPFGSAASSALNVNISVGGIPSRGLASAVPLTARGISISALPSMREERLARTAAGPSGTNAIGSAGGSARFNAPASGPFAGSRGGRGGMPPRGPPRDRDDRGDVAPPTTGGANGWGRSDGTRYTKTQPSLSYRPWK